MLDKVQKLTIAIRYWLLAKEYYTALNAMEFASKYHTGTRRDNITPEFSHQLLIAHYLRTVSSLLYPEETIVVAFLHDVQEDYGVSTEEIQRRFGDRIAQSTWLVTKSFNGVKKSLETYYDEMSKDSIASICKAADRIHNIQSMVDVFTMKGQKWYVEETEKFIIPMIKKARRLFPRQEAAYENAKHILTSQVELIQIIHAARDSESTKDSQPDI